MAKKNINPVTEKLQKIYDLQVIDSKIDAIQILKGELPIEVKDLEDEIAGLENRVTTLADSIADIDTEIANHNNNIKTSEALIARYNKQLDEVKNNREYEALTKEIELQNLEIQLSQKKIKDSNFGKDSKKEMLANAKDKKKAKVADLDHKQVELEKIIAKTEKDEKKLRKESDKAKKEIDERFLKAYDKVRNRYRNGLAVVTIRRNACGGCFNRIPPQLQIEIQNRKEIVACEHCGRVLVDNETAGILEETEA